MTEAPEPQGLMDLVHHLRQHLGPGHTFAWSILRDAPDFTLFVTRLRDRATLLVDLPKSALVTADPEAIADLAGRIRAALARPESERPLQIRYP